MFWSSLRVALSEIYTLNNKTNQVWVLWKKYIQKYSMYLNQGSTVLQIQSQKVLQNIQARKYITCLQLAKSAKFFLQKRHIWIKQLHTNVMWPCAFQSRIFLQIWTSVQPLKCELKSHINVERRQDGFKNEHIWQEDLLTAIFYCSCRPDQIVTSFISKV